MATPAGRGLVRASFVYAAGLALQRGLSVLVLPAATRILEPAEVGVASAALAVAGLLAVVLALGFNFAVVRLYHDERPDAPRTRWAMLLRVQLLLSLALAGLAWALGPVWSRMFEDVAWSGALQAAVLLALAQAAQTTSLGVLRAARRLAAFSAVVVAQVSVGGTLALVLADQHGAAGLVGGLAAGAGAGAITGAVLTYRRPAWSWPPLRAGLALALPFVAHMLSAWVLALSDRVLVERLLDLDRLASYHVAYALAALPILLTDAVQAAWVPHYYGLAASAKAALPRRLLPGVTDVVAAGAAGVALLAPAGGRLLAPPEFDFPLTVVALVTSATLVRAGYLVAFAVVSDAKSSRPIARASSAGAVLNVVLNLVLIPLWGLNGAAAATLISYALMSLLLLRHSERLLATSLDLGSLTIRWGAATGLVVALAHLPTGPGGWALRSVLAVAAVAVGWRAGRRARDGYRQVLTTPVA